MFTGIVETMGSVSRLTRRGGGARLEVAAPAPVMERLQIGDSVSVNGACVTVTEMDGQGFACDLVPETVARTNLGILQPGEQVNLERPMRAGDRFGGHIVQGHVDCVGLVRSRRRVGAQEMLEVTIPFELTRYLAPQGSVAVDGVSLTVVAVDRDRFRVALIPHTVASTTLGQKGQGAAVNVEVDVLSKYVERHLGARTSRPQTPFDESRAEPEVPAAAPQAKVAAQKFAAPKPPPPKTSKTVKRAKQATVTGAKRPAKVGAAAKSTRAVAAARRPAAVRRVAAKRPAKRRPASGRRR